MFLAEVLPAPLKMPRINSTQRIHPYRVYEAVFHVPLRSKVKKSLLLSIFDEAGIDPLTIIESVYKSKIKLSCFVQDETQTKRIKQLFKLISLTGISLTLRTLEKEDWFDKWKESYHTFKLGKHLQIVPVWEKENTTRKTSLTRIYLDPGAAFGSGTHETTKLMIQMMDCFKGEFKSVLDVGTGTGILAIAAQKMGATDITAFDLDPLSVEATRINLKLNHCRANVKRVFLEKFKPEQTWDLVLGNLISKCLTDHQEVLARCVKPGGILIVSGILKSNLPQFIRDFYPVGLKQFKVFRGRSWAGILYKKEVRS